MNIIELTHINREQTIQLLELQEAIKQVSKKYGIPHQEVENIVLNEIKDIFI